LIDKGKTYSYGFLSVYFFQLLLHAFKITTKSSQTLTVLSFLQEN